VKAMFIYASKTTLSTNNNYVSMCLNKTLNLLHLNFLK
jgi:hypothetical protein